MNEDYKTQYIVEQHFAVPPRSPHTGDHFGFIARFHITHGYEEETECLYRQSILHKKADPSNLKGGKPLGYQGQKTHSF